ncbi:MAG: hypothetical protein WCY30_02305 [Candidatus Neomarinimicrobiota bacterium]|jgi:hypothetical protein
MRPVKEVTAEQENFRFEPINGINMIEIYSEINLVVTPEELKTLFNT